MSTRGYRAIVRIAFVALLLCAGLARLAAPAGAQDTDAQIRVVHTSPDSPAVDIWIDGEATFTGMKFDTSSALTAVPAGDHDVAVVPKGADIADALLESTITVEGGQAYEIAIVGLAADLDLQTIPLDLSPVTDGSFRIQFVNTAADGTAVDIADKDGNLLVEGLEFGDVSDAAEMAAGTYGVQLLDAGTDTVERAINGIPLHAGKVYDVFVVGQAADATLNFLVLSADASTAVGGGSTTDSGTTSTTTTPNTGVGVTAGSGSSSLWLIALAAVAAGLAGFAVRGRQAGARS